MAEINDDINGKMLAAMLFEPVEDVIITTATHEEQVTFLKKYINTVTVEDRRDIGRLLIMNNRAEFLIECPEGTVINLDAVPQYIVLQMYDMLKSKIDKLSQ